LLRIIVTAAHKLLQVSWFVRRPSTLGAHALPLTPEGRIVLVKLRYAKGWRAPGGGRNAGEDPREAALRELREEIGLVSHGDVRFAGENAEEVNFKRDTSTLHIVEDVQYRPPRWSLEIEQVREFDIDDIPADTHVTTRRWIEQLRREQ